MPERLPIVNGDDGQWGTILNNYLRVTHSTEGYVNPGSAGGPGIVMAESGTAVDTGTGFYRSAVGRWNWVSSGVEVTQLNPFGAYVSGTASLRSIVTSGLTVTGPSSFGDDIAGIRSTGTASLRTVVSSYVAVSGVTSLSGRISLNPSSQTHFSGILNGDITETGTFGTGVIRVAAGSPTNPSIGRADEAPVTVTGGIFWSGNNMALMTEAQLLFNHTATTYLAFLSPTLPVCAAPTQLTLELQQTMTANSGTQEAFRFQGTYAPGSGGTPTDQFVIIRPTINWSGTPGAGRYEALVIQPLEASLPTGTNYLMRAFAGSSGDLERFSVTNQGNASLSGWLNASSGVVTTAAGSFRSLVTSGLVVTGAASLGGPVYISGAAVNSAVAWIGRAGAATPDTNAVPRLTIGDASDSNPGALTLAGNNNAANASMGRLQWANYNNTTSDKRAAVCEAVTESTSGDYYLGFSVGESLAERLRLRSAAGFVLTGPGSFSGMLNVNAGLNQVTGVASFNQVGGPSRWTGVATIPHGVTAVTVSAAAVTLDSQVQLTVNRPSNASSVPAVSADSFVAGVSFMIVGNVAAASACPVAYTLFN